MTIFEKQRVERIGEIKQNNEGCTMKIVQYNSSQDIIVEFQDEYKYRMKTCYGNFVKGTLSNPYFKKIYGVGYIGVGNYEQTEKRNGKASGTKAYDAWSKMLARCYSGSQKYSAYKGCTVSSDWHNFQNFAKWFYENYYTVDGQTMEVDKDWLVIGNKEYSHQNCCIAPNIINTCVLTHAKIRYTELPTGISYSKCVNKNNYKVRLSYFGKRITLGTRKNLKEAMELYKTNKINYIEEIANKYKENIPHNLYLAMMNFRNNFNLYYPEYKLIG